MYNPFSLLGKTILVTGASSGIGRAIALECSKMGASLVITGRSEERLDATFRALEGPGRYYQIQHAFCGELDVKEFMEKLPNVEKLDGVVHCAGVWKLQSCLFVKEADYMYHLSTNLITPLLLNRFLLKEADVDAESLTGSSGFCRGCFSADWADRLCCKQVRSTRGCASDGQGVDAQGNTCQLHSTRYGVHGDGLCN